jgi:hypothetical protein
MDHTILLMQDNAEERSELLLAFANAAPNVRLCVAKGGAEAHSYLSGLGIYADRESYPIPQLVLVDIDASNQSRMMEAGGWVLKTRFSHSVNCDNLWR